MEMLFHSGESVSTKTHLFGNCEEVTTLRQPTTKKEHEKLLGCGFECISVAAELTSSRISWTHSN